MLISVKINTYNKAFVLAAVVAGFSGALLLEYHKRDPLQLFVTEDTLGHTLYNITITIVVAALAAYASLWTARFLFGYGKSDLVRRQ